MTIVGQPLGRELNMPVELLDALLPMHLWFGPDGGVLRAGPTLQKLVDDGDLTGRSVMQVIEFRRPIAITNFEDLRAYHGSRLGLHLSGLPDLQFRGQLLFLGEDAGGLINISLGVAFADAVERRRLTLSDFSPCDQTVELLYLREANAAVSRESRKLTDRLVAAERAAQARASTDSLTGLANRRALNAALEALYEDQRPDFTLINLDLDFFKEINDKLGHAAGDAVLTKVARVLKSEIRENDIAARVGGDEFVLVLRHCDDPEIVDRIAKRLISRLEEPMLIDGEVCKISASAGSARSSQYPNIDPEQMMRDADVALYASKRGGRGQHTFFHPDLINSPS